MITPSCMLRTCINEACFISNDSANSSHVPSRPLLPLESCWNIHGPMVGACNAERPKRSFQHCQKINKVITSFFLHEQSCNHFQCVPRTLEPKALRRPTNLRITLFSNRFSHYLGESLRLWFPGATVGPYIPLREPRRPEPQNRLTRSVEGIWRLLLCGICK